MKRILFLEDDEVLAESLIDLLESEQFKIVHVMDGESVLEYTFEQYFDIYLFDVNVPGMGGFELLKYLRESGDDTPTIFLTAMSDIDSLSKGFNVGADDYIKKPFDFDELVIRLNAIVKKQYKIDKIGKMVFNFDKNELYNGDVFLSLSPYELSLTQLFFKNIDKTICKDILCDELSLSDGSLRVHIAKLRKIGLPIQTVKGVGYRLGRT